MRHVDLVLISSMSRYHLHRNTSPPTHHVGFVCSLSAFIYIKRSRTSDLSDETDPRKVNVHSTTNNWQLSLRMSFVGQYSECRVMTWYVKFVYSRWVWHLMRHLLVVHHHICGLSVDGILSAQLASSWMNFSISYLLTVDTYLKVCVADAL